MPSKTPTCTEYDRPGRVAVGRNEGLSQCFRAQALQNPSSVAIVDEETTFTYEDLHSRATILPQELRCDAFVLEEPVGIIVQHGMADVLSQMAILYAGGSCVPMDPTLPDPQTKGRLQKLGSRYIMVDKANAQRNLSFRQLVIDDRCPFSNKNGHRTRNFPSRPTSDIGLT